MNEYLVLVCFSLDQQMQQLLYLVHDNKLLTKRIQWLILLLQKRKIVVEQKVYGNKATLAGLIAAGPPKTSRSTGGWWRASTWSLTRGVRSTRPC